MLEITYKLQGTKVMMVQTHKDERTGKVTRETIISQGEQAAELANAEERLAEETVRRDGIQNAAAETPAPATGPQGRQLRYFLRGTDVFEEEIRRVRDGSIHVQRATNMGNQSRALAHCNERVAELTAHRDGVRDAT